MTGGANPNVGGAGFNENTYLLDGTSDPGDIISSTKEAVYIKHLGGQDHVGRLVTLATFFLLGGAVSPGAVLDAWGGDWFAFVVVWVPMVAVGLLSWAGAAARAGRLRQRDAG